MPLVFLFGTMNLDGGRKPSSSSSSHHSLWLHPSSPYQELLATRTISHKPNLLRSMTTDTEATAAAVSSEEPLTGLSNVIGARGIHDEENVLANREQRSISAPPVAEHVRWITQGRIGLVFIRFVGCNRSAADVCPDCCGNRSCGT